MNPHSWQATSAEPVAVTTATEVPIVWLLMEAVITKPGDGYGGNGGGFGHGYSHGHGYVYCYGYGDDSDSGGYGFFGALHDPGN